MVRQPRLCALSGGYNPNAEGDGEIVVRTPGQTVGYGSSREVDLIDDNGWVHTGDQGQTRAGSSAGQSGQGRQREWAEAAGVWTLVG
ncbi:MAG: hypothetical protein M3Z25_20290 [Actinomycetota bacterium]|nr:hypothetical protein [Actinomycetota bacterium]